jgi:hypothetical protein
MKNLFVLIIASIIVLSVKAQNVYEVTKENNKFIYGGYVKLFPGDKIFVEATVSNDSLSEFRVVNANNILPFPNL